MNEENDMGASGGLEPLPIASPRPEAEDPYADLRAALWEATPGPWRRGFVRTYGIYSDATADDNALATVPAYDGHLTPRNPQGDADARYIELVSPDRVAVLLTDRDSLADALRVMTEGHAAMHRRGGVRDCAICAAIEGVARGKGLDHAHAFDQQVPQLEATAWVCRCGLVGKVTT